MRKMKDRSTNTVINVTEFFMTRNMWEYYVTDNKFNEDIVCCLVLGFENELGDVSLAEVGPYKITHTKDLSELAPAPGWEWVD